MLGRKTVAAVYLGMIAAFTIGVLCGVAGYRIAYLNVAMEKRVLEMSTIPPLLPEWAVSGDARDKKIEEWERVIEPIAQGSDTASE
jgi:hypothetical protein